MQCFIAFIQHKLHDLLFVIKATNTTYKNSPLPTSAALGSESDRRHFSSIGKAKELSLFF